MSVAPLDPARVREEFPIFAVRPYGKRLVYLDSAASAQKPQAVIDAVAECYASCYANVHRGVHYLSELATERFEAARERVREFLGAADPREIVFVRGATEAINLVASSYGRTFLREGDEVLLTQIEHHSNIVPWQILRDMTGVRLVVAPVDDRGELHVEEIERRLGARTRFVAVTHLSNALGTITPVAEIVRAAHAVGAKVLVDGCQAVPHLRVDVQDLDADFYVFSGHKLYGPSGIGVLYGKRELLEAMPPYQGGGEMIREVTFARTEFAAPPARFEAGTPHVAGAIGLHAAIDWLGRLGLEAVAAHERELLAHLHRRLEEIEGVRVLGRARHRASIVSFLTGDVHPHDAATILDRQGVAVRAGHHCAQPTMERFGVPATVRASLGVYNDFEDVDRLATGIRTVLEVFA